MILSDLFSNVSVVGIIILRIIGDGGVFLSMTQCWFDNPMISSKGENIIIIDNKY